MIDFRKIYEEHADEELCKSSMIKPERRLSQRDDLNGLMLLDRLCPGKMNMISSAERDEIWFDVEIDELNRNATEEDALDIIRSGIWYDLNLECLGKFV